MLDNQPALQIFKILRSNLRRAKQFKKAAILTQKALSLYQNNPLRVTSLQYMIYLRQKDPLEMSRTYLCNNLIRHRLRDIWRKFHETI